MFKPGKTNNFSGNPGTFLVIVATLLTFSLVIQIFAIGSFSKVIILAAIIFAVWWVYTYYLKEDSESDQAKYLAAVEQQKKSKGNPRTKSSDKSNVVYLDVYKRK